LIGSSIYWVVSQILDKVRVRASYGVFAGPSQCLFLPVVKFGHSKLFGRGLIVQFKDQLGGIWHKTETQNVSHQVTVLKKHLHLRRIFLHILRRMNFLTQSRINLNVK
jgi:hypothetical protein